MSALDRRITPASVAPTPGKELKKFTQRFHLLSPENREQLLETAFYMIQRQLDEKLSPREREIKQLIEQIERCLEYLAENVGVDSIQTRVSRGILEDDKKRLLRLGVDYFGDAT